MVDWERIEYQKQYWDMNLSHLGISFTDFILYDALNEIKENLQEIFNALDKIARGK